MSGLFVLLLIAAVGFGLARWLRMPVIPLLIIPGVLLSMAGVAPDADVVRAALDLGLTFLLFAAGIELNPKRFRTQRAAVVLIAMGQFVMIGVCGFALALVFNFDWITALYVGFAIATSSTLVILRHLRQQQQLFEPFGRVVTGVLLLQDLFMIMIIIGMTRAPAGLAAVAGGVGSGLTLLALAFLCQRWLMPLLVVRMKLDDETLLLSILALLFGFAGVARVLQVPPIVGAFLAGFALSAFPVNGLVRGLLASISDFFLAIFFTALGAIVMIPDLASLLHGIALAALILLLTPPLVTMIAESRGISSRSAIESGLLLAQTSEFSIVLCLTGLVLGHLTQEVFSTIALVTVLTMSLTPFIATDRMTERLLRWHPARRRLPTEPVTRDHVLLLGFGSTGMWVVKHLRDAKWNVLVIDDDPVVVDQLAHSEIPFIRGDGADEKILRQAGARHARLIIATMRRVGAAEKVLRHVRNVPVLVRLFEAADAERIRQLGGTPILNSVAAAETFMGWFEKSGRIPVRARGSG